MKKILLGMGLLAAMLANQAMASDNAFTHDEAVQHCPAEGGLTFEQANPNITNGQVSMSGVNGVNFVSFNLYDPSPLHNYVYHPIQSGTEGILEGAHFYQINGKGYGFIGNNKVINCFYSYTSFKNANFILVMRSK